MERDPQKVSAVLADPTRYGIYRFLLSAPQPLSVPAVAREFSLHPNVARMHLGRLAEIGLVNARPEKTGRGGRPALMYEPSGSAVSLTVPVRDFQLLADLLVQSLALIGDGASEAVEQIGLTFGRKLGREAIHSLGRLPSGSDEPFQVCALALERLGVAASVTVGGEVGASLVLRTCGFQELAAAHPDQICHLCKSMVQGITEVCVEAATEVVQSASLPRGDRACVYEMNGLIRLE